MQKIDYDRKFSEAYQKLNPEQKEAVDTIDGPLLVVAGPGSGKTQILSLRVANILKQTDTLPSSILCLTFTDSASTNMRERLFSVIGSDAYKVAIHTFHSFGTEVINQNQEYFFLGVEYKPADDLARLAIIENLLSELPPDHVFSSKDPEHGWIYLKDINSKISDLKKAGLNPKMFAEILERDRIFLEGFNELVKEFFNVDYKPNKAIEKLPEFIEKVEDLKEGENQIQTVFETAKQTHLKKLNQVVEEINKIEGKQGKTRPLTTWKDKNLKKNKDNQFILADYEKLEKNLALVNFYEKYQEELHKQKLFDFEDMLLEVADKMKENPELCYNQREKYLYILVDEFQDTSGVQMRLLEGLIDMEISDGSPNLMVVGDDDQSVFKFQGASVQNILDFEKRYKNIKKVTLTKNYRSKQEILNFATNVIENCQTRLEGVNKVLESQV